MNAVVTQVDKKFLEMKELHNAMDTLIIDYKNRDPKSELLTKLIEAMRTREVKVSREPLASQEPSRDDAPSPDAKTSQPGTMALNNLNSGGGEESGGGCSGGGVYSGGDTLPNQFKLLGWEE